MSVSSLKIRIENIKKNISRNRNDIAVLQKKIRDIKTDASQKTARLKEHVDRERKEIKKQQGQVKNCRDQIKRLKK